MGSLMLLYNPSLFWNSFSSTPIGEQWFPRLHYLARLPSYANAIFVGIHTGSGNSSAVMLHASPVVSVVIGTAARAM